MHNWDVEPMFRRLYVEKTVGSREVSGSGRKNWSLLSRQSRGTRLYPPLRSRLKASQRHIHNKICASASVNPAACYETGGNDPIHSLGVG